MSEDFFEDLKETKKKVKRTTFSITEDVLEEFNKICKARSYNKSKIVENFMKKFVEQEKSLIK